jgi:hypothetical protein
MDPKTEQKKVEDMTTAELGLAYGKLVEQVYRAQIQVNMIEAELKTRIDLQETDDVPCDNPE